MDNKEKVTNDEREDMLKKGEIDGAAGLDKNPHYQTMIDKIVDGVDLKKSELSQYYKTGHDKGEKIRTNSTLLLRSLQPKDLFIWTGI